MKTYPKIEYHNHNKGLFGEHILAWDKLDGSNIRAEWSKKRGWYKFGTKNVMIDEKSDDFGQTIPLFLNKYGDSIPRIFVDKYKKIENFVVFSEYVGENSFSGQHDKNDIMDIVLFDVNQYKRGFIPPIEFLDNFCHLHTPKLIYDGEYTEEFIKDIRNNRYNLKEGVIAKGMFLTKNKKEEVWMVKIKCNEWLHKVKSRLGDKALQLELNNDKQLISEYE